MNLISSKPDQHITPEIFSRDAKSANKHARPASQSRLSETADEATAARLRYLATISAEPAAHWNGA